MLSQWEKRRAAFDPLVTSGEGKARRRANEELRASVANLRPVSARLPLDASEHDVCNHAWEMAERCRVRLIAVQAEQQRAPLAVEVLRAAGLTREQAEAVDVFEQRAVLAQMCGAGGIAAPAARYDDGPAVRRMVAAHWWRGQLRKVHAKAVERAAIGLNLVAKDRECYVSSVSLEARRR